MFIQRLADMGYESIREVPGQGLCALQKFAFTTGIIVGLDSVCYRGRYCYADRAEAQLQLDAWDGQGDPGGAWIKYKGEGGDRSNVGCKNCGHGK